MKACFIGHNMDSELLEKHCDLFSKFKEKKMFSTLTNAAKSNDVLSSLTNSIFSRPTLLSLPWENKTKDLQVV